MSPPTQIGRYHVVGHLASGGMAEILLGKLIGPSGFERPVVIKRILPNLAKEESFRTMFLDEARVVARIQHPNVVHVTELGQEGDELFLVMEYLEGESVLSLLRRAMSRGDGLEPELGAYIVAQACAGLHAAHELTGDDGQPLGLVHRDVSPSNIFVTFRGAVKLLDFGIAKFNERSTDTEAGQLKGKFSYMSPEQCLAGKVDRRSDVFAMGIVLFEVTTGRRLFARDSSLLTMQAITEGTPPSPKDVDPSYPESLARICQKALQRDPALRYESAAHMRRDLMAALRELHTDELPEEALAERMKRYFGDRIDEKKELLRRVSSGSQITNVPMAEVDVSVELPTVFSTGGGHLRSAVAVAPVKERSRTLVVVAAALVLLVGVGIGVGLALAGGGDDEAEGAPPIARQAGIPETEVSEIVEPAELPAAPAPVSVRLESTPAGATVRVDGYERGVTPLSIELARSETPVELELSRDGFVADRRTLVPSANATLQIALTRERRGARRPTKAAPTASGGSSGSTSPFRRFN